MAKFAVKNGKAKVERPKLLGFATDVDKYAGLKEWQDDLEIQMKETKAKMVDPAFLEFIRFNKVSNKFSGSVEVPGIEHNVLLTFNSGYRSAYLKEDIEPIIGKEETKLMFTSSTKLSIACDAFPEEHREKFMNDLEKLIKLYKVDPEVAVVMETKLVPLKTFNENKIARLTETQLLALEKVVPTPVTLKISDVKAPK